MFEQPKSEIEQRLTFGENCWFEKDLILVFDNGCVKRGWILLGLSIDSKQIKHAFPVENTPQINKTVFFTLHNSVPFIRVSEAG